MDTYYVASTTINLRNLKYDEQRPTFTFAILARIRPNARFPRYARDHGLRCWQRIMVEQGRKCALHYSTWEVVRIVRKVV